VTPQEHNKYVGIAHLIYAAFHLLMMLASFIFMGVMFGTMFGRAETGFAPPPPAFLGLIFVFVAVFNVLTTIPSLLAGYALLKRKSWAKVAGIVGAVVAAMSFPIGTAVAVYTFWFLFSEPGKLLYDKKLDTLPPPPPTDWQPRPLHQSGNRESELPVSPPDWR
jgi:hypothetical protein